LSNDSTIFPVDKEFHLVYLVWVFKKVCRVVFVVGLFVAVVVAWTASLKDAVWVLMIAGGVEVVGRVR
jgi:hypothetical protein